MKEIWKTIKGFENYQVSNLGNVKTLERDYINNFGHKVHITEKLMKFTTRSGYYNVNLRKDCKRYSKQVHRLVAENFLDNPNNYPVVNHKDFNRKNNRVDNLEFVTQKENVNWSKENMKGLRVKNAKTYGITYRDRGYGYYEVVIKRQYIGRANTYEEAVELRDKALIERGLYSEVYNIK